LLFVVLLALLLGLVVSAVPAARRRLAGAGHGGEALASPTPRTPPAPPARPAPPTRAPSPRAANPSPPARRLPPRTSTSRASEFDEKLSLMAAEVFVALTRGGPESEDEGHGRDPHAQVKLDSRDETAPDPHPAPWHAAVWAREHLTQAALVATVIVSGLARRRRRGHRRGSRQR
jgi:hypothetical protein